MKKLFILLAVIIATSSLSFGYTIQNSLLNNNNPQNKYRSYYYYLQVSSAYMSLYVYRGGDVDNTMDFVESGLLLLGPGYGGFLGETVGASLHHSSNSDSRWIYIAPQGVAYWINMVLDCPMYLDYARASLSW